MTLEEAKKIVTEEGFSLEGPGRRSCAVSEAFMEYESPEVCEAMQVASSAGFRLAMLAGAFDERKTRLKKEYEKCTKAPGPGEEEPKEDDLKAATKMFGAQAREIMRLTAENAELRETIDKMKEGNPALKESASQFNDALLDEQAKKIEKLANENERLKDQIAILDACKKHNDKIDRLQIKRLGKEISKLNGIIHDKNEELKRKTKGCCELITENVDLKKKLSDKDAVLADVAEELRLSKIREKNLTELCQKYIKANEELKKKLADKVVDKIDAQVLKSAESALAWKEKVIAEKDMALAYNKKEIADLNEKLAAAKKELKRANNLVEIVRKGSREYCEYGIAAEKMIQKLSKIIVSKGLVPSDVFEKCRLWAKGYRFNPQLSERTDKEEKKLSSSRDYHPTIDNPEEIEIEKSIILVRKAMKEGHTVTIDYKD